MARTVTDTELAQFADRLLAESAILMPKGVDADDLVDRLAGWAPGLQGVHIDDTNPNQDLISI